MCQITRKEIHVLCRLCEAHFSCVIPRKSYLVDRPFLTLDCSSVSRASKKTTGRTWYLQLPVYRREGHLSSLRQKLCSIEETHRKF
jgi:hypothetical protein